MKQYKKELGKVSVSAEGKWNIDNAYERISIVFDEHTEQAFISKCDVPVGIDLYNREYWMPLNVSGYSDSNTIILNKKINDFEIKSYSLEEAIKSIKLVGRKPGCILIFYNSNSERLDIGGCWEIWQFNDTNIYNWENIKSWRNIINNSDEEDLTVIDNKLKIKDREYDKDNFSGLGHVILRKNIKSQNGKFVNILTQAMINKSNTIYEIRYDFDLNGEEVTIPEGCVLDFQGGSLSNGKLIGVQTTIQADLYSHIFKGVELFGRYDIDSISFCWFGAKGDGVTDNTIAFKTATNFAFNMSKISISQVSFPINSIKLILPYGIYVTSGNRIFGSPLENDDEILTEHGNYPKNYYFDGDGSTILWNLEKEDDILFNIDSSLDRPIIKDLSIFTVDNSNNILCGGTVFYLRSIFNREDHPEMHASNGLYENINICAGRSLTNFEFVTVVDKVFNVTGYGKCDRSLVVRCDFSYCRTIFKCSNPEAVNWTFDSCSISSHAVSRTHLGRHRLFDIEAMFDNFNVLNSSVVLTGNDTLLYVKDTTPYGITTNCTFTFTNNRIELQYDTNKPEYIPTIVCIDKGKFILKNSNLNLGSGGPNRCIALNEGSFSFYDITFNTSSEIYIPINVKGESSIRVRGHILTNCVFPPYSVGSHFYATNGIDVNDSPTSKRTLQDIYVEDAYRDIMANVTLENFTYGGGLQSYNHQFILDRDPQYCPLKINEIKGANINYGITKSVILPSFICITNINGHTVASPYKTLRIEFGYENNSVCDSIDIPITWDKTNTFSIDTEINILAVTPTIKYYFIDDEGNIKTDTPMSLNIKYRGIAVGGMVDFKNSKFTRHDGGISLSNKGKVRPTMDNKDILKGFLFFDLNLNKPIWWTGEKWVDATGAEV